VEYLAEHSALAKELGRSASKLVHDRFSQTRQLARLEHHYRGLVAEAAPAVGTSPEDG
jgi:hypothetical protein